MLSGRGRGSAIAAGERRWALAAVALQEKVQRKNALVLSCVFSMPSPFKSKSPSETAKKLGEPLGGTPGEPSWATDDHRH